MILVTGGYGCIGSELVKWLLRNTQEEVLLASRTVSSARTERIFHDVERTKLTCIQLDVSDQTGLKNTFRDFDIDRVAHLAALQTPDCNAHKDLGLQINLGGTQNIIEAVKTHGASKLKRFVFASSIAIYGPRDSYPKPQVPVLAEPNPVNVYGVWKLGSEHLLKFFHQETGVPAVSIRPGVLFGPGRDVGLTSTPTTALKCVALGTPYEIPFSSKQDYLYAPDVGAAFANALLEPFEGYGAFTLPARTISMREVVSTMQAAAETAGLADQFQITHGNAEVPFICELEYAAFTTAFPNTPHTDFQTALVDSLNVFKTQVAQGWLTADDIT